MRSARHHAKPILGGVRYVVTGSLGAGSQGETLAAIDDRDRPVAIKRFTIRGAKSWKDVELAEREANVLASLKHPNLPRYIEHFSRDGALYLVMEKVEGENLQAFRRRRGRLNQDQVLRFLRDAADCLRYLHSHTPPIVHRDIKPGNVILRPDGSYCLVDFGAVRDHLRPEGGSTIVGTFGFMAPEQFQGRAAPTSDVYAVGATALCLITDQEPANMPHRGLAIDVEGALQGQIDRRLLRALRSMLEVDPDRRPSSVDVVLRHMHLRARNDDTAARRQKTRSSRLPRWIARAMRDGVPVIPLLGTIILLALGMPSIATFALVQVLLPVLLQVLCSLRRDELLPHLQRPMLRPEPPKITQPALSRSQHR